MKRFLPLCPPACLSRNRYSLSMSCYTFTGILACTYLGCCDVTVTWQTMAAKAVPTALGALFGLALTALVLPRFASSALLAQQAGILRDAFRTLRRCWGGGLFLQPGDCWGCCCWGWAWGRRAGSKRSCGL